MGREGYLFIIIYYVYLFPKLLIVPLAYFSLVLVSACQSAYQQTLFIWCLQHLCQNVNWHQ